MGVTVRCLKCGHENFGKKRDCIYCGASLEGETSREISYIVDKKSSIFISDKQKNEVNFNELPEKVRRKIEDAVSKGKNEVIVKKETSVFQPHPTSAKQEHALSFEKVLALLSEMKNSFSEGRIEYDVYERMASDIVKDYISTLDDHIKVDFVINEIKNSEIYDYLDDKMIKDLKTFVISSVSDKRIPRGRS
jgi:hypothetical protein